MIKDANRARTMLMCPPGTDENALNRIAFGMHERFKEIVRFSGSDKVTDIVKSQMGVLESIYHDDGSLQENETDYGVAHDAWVCNKTRQYIADNRFDKTTVEARVTLLSGCKNAESKYLAAVLLIKTSNDYDTCSRALHFIENAYKLEPFNPLYEDFYKGLFETVDSISSKIRQEALERKRIAEMELRRAEERQQEIEWREKERLRKAEEEKKKQNLKTALWIGFFILLFLGIAMGW